MIKPGEIDRIANSKQVRSTQIQKDYVITWILWGVSNTLFLRENLLFKGGTCLKKIYFEDYRYSEDLDFTLVDDSIKNEQIILYFESLFTRIYDESRIKIEIANGSYEILESGSIKFNLSYTGTHGSDKIKIDLTRGENIVCGTTEQYVLKGYSDIEEEDFSIQVYTLKEVLIEKLVALMGRTIPRDLFDFNYLTEVCGMELHDVYIEFMIKAENKGHHPMKFIDKVAVKEGLFKRDWDTSLSKQMRKEDLPEFNTLWRKAINQFKALMKMMENS